MKLSHISYNQGIILAFAVGFVVRLIPELLSFPYPIGWDTIYYAFRINDGLLFGFWGTPFSSWLLYGIMLVIRNLTLLDPFILLKIIAPILFGGSTAGIYFVAWKKLCWSSAKSLLVSGFFAFQLAALTISWQFYRNVFGVMILLFALPLIRCEIGWKGTAGLSVLSLLIAWGHEFAAISLIFIVFGLLVLSVFRKEKIPYRLFVAIVPALVVFFGNFLWVSPFPHPVPTNLVWIPDNILVHPNGLFFLTDYISVNTPIESYNSYFDLFYQVSSLFVLLYALLLPLIGVGYFKDRVFNVWTTLLLIGSLGLLVLPFSALLLWERWMLMLVYPFAFFAANGLWKVGKSFEWVNSSKFLGKIKFKRRIGVCLALLSVTIGVLFMVWPLVDGRYGVIGWGGTFNYVPSTMQSSSVPLRDIEGVIEAYDWVNSNMDANSSLLVHDVFEFWTLLYLDSNHVAYIFRQDLEIASNHALTDGFESTYFVWWNEDIGWYNLRLSTDWYSVYDSGRISVYKIV